MNNSSSLENAEALQSCDLCGMPFFGRSRWGAYGTRICSKKTCRALMAEFEDFYTLRELFSLSRWTGGKPQEQIRKEYYTYKLRRAIKSLERNEDLLGKVLIEIVEDMA